MKEIFSLRTRVFSPQEIQFLRCQEIFFVAYFFFLKNGDTFSINGYTFFTVIFFFSTAKDCKLLVSNAFLFAGHRFPLICGPFAAAGYDSLLFEAVAGVIACNTPIVY